MYFPNSVMSDVLPSVVLILMTPKSNILHTLYYIILYTQYHMIYTKYYILHALNCHTSITHTSNHTYIKSHIHQITHTFIHGATYKPCYICPPKEQVWHLTYYICFCTIPMDHYKIYKIYS